MGIHFLQFIKDWKTGVSTFSIETSGSTGAPKSIELTLAQLKYSSAQTAKAFGFHRDTKIFNCIPTDKIGGFMNWVRSIHLKLEIQTVNPSADPMIHLASNHNFTFISLVPYQIQAILKSDESRNKLNQFDTVLLGGSKLNLDLISVLQELRPTFWQSYGMTETCSHVALKNISAGEDGYSTIGDVKIEADENNCAQIKGTITNNKLLQTKDVIEFTSQGRFKVIGRLDNVINTGGIKVFPELVEKMVYNAIDNLSDGEIVASSVPDSGLGEKLVLVTIRKDLSLENIEFDKFQSPKEVIVVEEIPVLENGKLDRRGLKRILSNTTL